MNKTIGFFTIALCGAFLFAACSGSADKTESHEENNSKETTEQVAKVKELNAEDWQGKYDQLFTLEMAAEVMGFSPDEAKIKYDASSSYFQEVRYSWENGRTTQLKSALGGTYTVPTDDYIILRSIEEMTLNLFKNSYRELTQEESDYLDNALDKKAEEGEISEGEAELGKDIGETISGTLSFEDVSNLGEHAIWNNKTKELHVYTGGLKFTVVIGASDDTEADKVKAVQAAQMILVKL